MNSISIYNYKNFKHLEISDIGNVNLVVGKNNAGKSWGSTKLPWINHRHE